MVSRSSRQGGALSHGVAVPELYFKINSQYFAKFVPVGSITDNNARLYSITPECLQ